MSRVTARLTFAVTVEVDAPDGRRAIAVNDVCTEVGYYLDDWVPSVDGDHPDAVAWFESGTASHPWLVDIGVTS